MTPSLGRRVADSSDERALLLPNGHDQPEVDDRPTSGPRFYLLLAFVSSAQPSKLTLTLRSCLYSSYFISALSSSVVVSLAAPISGELGRGDLWSTIGAAYLGASCAFVPLFARLSDQYGRRPLIVAAGVIFIVGSTACAAAPSIWVLIFARGISGIGGGGLGAMATVVVSDLVSQRQRGVYGGLTNLAFAAGTALGGPLGGLIVCLSRSSRR